MMPLLEGQIPKFQLHENAHVNAQKEILAKNRDGFAIGAIIAADWIIGKKGVFSMKDVLAQ